MLYDALYLFVVISSRWSVGQLNIKHAALVGKMYPRLKPSAYIDKGNQCFIVWSWL